MEVGTNSSSPLPPLFPKPLQDKCVEFILDHLLRCGKTVEEKAEREIMSHGEESLKENAISRRRRRSSFMMDISDYLDATFLYRNENNNGGEKDHQQETDFTNSQIFKTSVAKSRKYLTNSLASHIFDKLGHWLTRKRTLCPGYTFSFYVICNERLNRLTVCLKEDGNGNPDAKWRTYLETPQGNDMILHSLSTAPNLSTLILHSICTNEMLYIISDACLRLQVLDISHSYQVTDLGLVYLCGSSRYELPMLASSSGCKYLRELAFNPQSSSGPGSKSSKPIMPKVVAFVLRHLVYLEVVDIECLGQGIDYYCVGKEGVYRPKMNRIPPLRLIHYTGPDNCVESVFQICPRMKTFKFMVTDSLPLLGQTLQDYPNPIDHVTLVFPPDYETLRGLSSFLKFCGKRLHSLQIEPSSVTKVTLDDIATINKECQFLEQLCFTSFKMNPTYESIPMPFIPFKMRYLRELRLSNIEMEPFAKEVVKLLIGGCHDIENLFLSFTEQAQYFSDFLLDDILILNPFGRIEHFFCVNVSLTLISALRLISSRPKLRSIGKILSWDVEESELVTFAQILRKANSLRLLQDIAIA